MVNVKHFTVEGDLGLRQCALISKPPVSNELQSANLIIFSHGTGNDLFFPYKNLFRKLVLNTDCDVLTYDLDGHGDKSTTTLDPTRIFKFLPFLVQNLHLFFDEKYQKIILIGHSLGACLSLSAALNCFENKIAMIVAISPPWSLAFKNPPVLEELAGFLKPSVLKQIFTYGPYGIIPAFGRFKRKRFPIKLENSSSDFYYYLPTVRMILDSTQKEFAAKKCTTPVAIISGNQDRIANFKEIPQFKQCFESAKIIEMPNENHFSTLFACEDQIVKVINEL